jgi:hypothetical protein
MSKSSIKHLEQQLVLQRQLYDDRMKAKLGTVSKKLCKHFILGSCKYDAMCRFRHDEQDAEKARAQRAKIEQARLKRETELALVTDTPQKPRTMTTTYDKTKSVRDIIMYRQIVSAMDDSDTSIEKKEKFFALFSVPITITLDTLHIIVKLEEELSAYCKIMLTTYIREKYQMEPEEYYSIWFRTCHDCDYRPASGYYYSVKIDQDHYVTTISPRDDVLIAAYVCSKAIDIGLVKHYCDFTLRGT